DLTFVPLIFARGEVAPAVSMDGGSHATDRYFRGSGNLIIVALSSGSSGSWPGRSCHMTCRKSV
ncbi:hypothetical protein, partial [Mesorhizobium sp. M7A.F.Ca.US.001.04.2.1]|uniref:hypothetical protein n=1 Tax=Mesorhizobium sp. M7A.F.Ca.US.001.04.2.1 TaxID=2496727 RepID=UPI0019D2B36C